MKKAKKWIWIAVAVVVVIGAAFAGSRYLQSNKEPVYVYGFDDGIAGMKDYVDYSNESGGMVTTDKLQPVYLSSTQTVLEILVSEGQSVKKGDVLFTYDTTLSDIALMQKDLAVQQAKLDLETAQRELKVINSYVPIRYYTPDPTEPTEPPEPVLDLKDFDLEGKDFLAYSGSGDTSLSPKYVWVRSGVMVDEAMMKSLFEDASQDVLFVRLRNTKEDKNDGELTHEYCLKMMRLKAGDDNGSEKATFRFWFFDPYAGSNAPVDPGVEWNSGFTSAQIAAMRAEKQQEIKEREFKIKMEEAELKIMQKEADSGEVTAEFDGIVMSIADADTASMQDQPFMKISGGGGFYITGSVSELQLGNIAVGQKVDIRSWDTGMTYEGTILEIGSFPQEDYRYYGENRNVSLYPYTVFVDESARLQDGFYVSMTLRGAEGASSLYVNSAFVRSEGAASYVFVRNDAGLLEKRYLQVGGSLWGSYTEVRGGLTAEDFLAFPYGKDVKEGAPTQEGTWENLHG